MSQSISQAWILSLLVGFTFTSPFAAIAGDRYSDALDWLSKNGSVSHAAQERILTGTRLSLYAPILEVLEAFHRQDEAEIFPKFSDLCAHQKTTLCREIESPLEAYALIDAPEISDASMTTVEGILKAILVVGNRTDWPSALKKVAWVRRLENLVRQVRIDEWQARLAEELGQVQSSQTRSELEAAQTFLREFAHQAALRAPNPRADLPYPLLTRDDRVLLSMFLGGVMWRFRGAGGYDDYGTRDRRRYFARDPFQAIAKLNGASPAFAHQLGWSTWFGLMQSWGRFHDIGRLNDTVASDFAEMKNRGEFAARFTQQLLGLRGYETDEMKAAGLQMASCYYFGWEGIDNSVQVGAHLKKPFLFIIGAPSNFGELCTGAVLASGLAQTLLTDKN